MNSLLFASFGVVFLKAFQQKNVMRNKYKMIPLATFGMAVSEVFLVIGVVEYGASWTSVINIFIGGTLGCWSGMYTHNKLFN
tara:strand:- start:11408 stop:11653 length:246 start_codon:yes stop_codon:yes gene_type:complete